MKNWTFKATPKLVEAIGEEWKGTYEIKMLMADEYLSIGDEIVSELRKEKGDAVPEALTKSMFNMRLLYKSVLHNGKPIAHNIPSKLIDVLMGLVLARNTMTLENTEEYLEAVENQNTKGGNEKE